MCATGFDILTGRDRVQAFELPRWPDEHLATLSLFFCAFRHSTVMFNRKVLGPDILEYRRGYAHAEDFELFRRVSASAPTRILPEPLIAYRMHAQSVTTTRGREMRRTHLRIVEENLRALGEPVHMPALLDVTSPPDAELLGDMLRLDAALRAARARVAPENLHPYDVGVEGMFFFLLHMANDEYGSALAVAFLDATNGWGRLRRRERLPLQAFRSTPALAGGLWRTLRETEAFRRRLGSRPLAQVVQERAAAQAPAGGA
jgi:hypothetical protein